MARPLRALIVEDSERDAQLLLRELRRGGFEPQTDCVQTESAMRTALARQGWDIVLSDWAMPQFSADAAFALLKQTGLDIPFVIVSGTIGEDTAVEAMRTGVHDFLVKGRLARLTPVIERELRDAETRRSRAAMARELRRGQEQADELEGAHRRALRESEIKSKFLASMSHELRTPLNAIIGFAELLQQEEPDALTPAQREYVQDILDSGLHLLSLVDDFLDLSRIEAGRETLRIEPTSLAGSVESVRAALATLAHKRGVQLELTVPADLPAIAADPLRIRQILYNLLSNAIKFTPTGGRVWLTAHASGQHLCIAVSDTGIGIAAHDLPRLFQEFERIEPTSGERPAGTGLGLALTRRLVALHGGSVAAESTPGAGSTFTVTLPIARPRGNLLREES